MSSALFSPLITMPYTDGWHYVDCVKLNFQLLSPLVSLADFESELYQPYFLML